MGQETKGFAVILSGPSGVGKTTLCKKLIELYNKGDSQKMWLSISCTTRLPRKKERDQLDYFFVSDTEFDNLLAQDQLLEWAQVHSHRYGTPRQSVEKALSEGKIVLFDIDVQGARSIQKYLKSVMPIFVLPPSFEKLIARLRGRKSEDAETLRKRLTTAIKEMACVNEFGAVILNDDLKETLDELTLLINNKNMQDEKLRHERSRLALQILDETKKYLETMLTSKSLKVSNEN